MSNCYRIVPSAPIDKFTVETGMTLEHLHLLNHIAKCDYQRFWSNDHLYFKPLVEQGLVKRIHYYSPRGGRICIGYQITPTGILTLRALEQKR